MLLRYLLFFILLAVVWRLVRGLSRLRSSPRFRTSADDRRRAARSGRHRDVDDAEYEILPEEGPDPD